ncbi:SH3 domain-containing protein, partial [Desulfococcus sp.]|uniref:SH3 domain-containing protein n=1 Tax=Desulfococcus sp. TaxID=2025834 RepID=UPI003592F4BF
VLAAPAPAPAPPRNLLLRAEATEGAPVVGVAPSLHDADLVEEGEDGWTRVNYRGVVGWVHLDLG